MELSELPRHRHCGSHLASHAHRRQGDKDSGSTSPRPDSPESTEYRGKRTLASAQQGPGHADV